MSEALVEGGADGELRLSGVLDYQTGPVLRRAGQGLIREGKGQRLLIDCSAVKKSSSVGLSLLLAFIRDAVASEREVAIVGMPDDMHQIARVSGLLDVLPFAGEIRGNE
ncbi:STAS domain-containing protein [Pseudomonas sp. KSR10]|uniref:STAS domain-containing protein n=1 Tax=Pseudomonas sp. KSR10 TaxID=2916654 RepID=UPI001EF7CA5C|nr:STAS domain-containing protein [Pseudomonas sp. KSR10]MCG6539971.1 STAS domain-containing protein [Pseudomonas sp. KSR10]